MQHDFQYVSKKNPQVRNAREEVITILTAVQDDLRKDYFTFHYTFIGSYSRNMITQDMKSNVGYDFDINIEINDDDNEYGPKEIKNILRNSINKFARQFGYDYAEDSTRVLTIKVKDRKNAKILHSVDFAIVNNYVDRMDNARQEYIHFDKSSGAYLWNEQPKGFYELPEKIDWLRENGYWQEVRSLYIKKKNNNTNPLNHSRSIFADTVNDVFDIEYENNEEDLDDYFDDDDDDYEDYFQN